MFRPRALHPAWVTAMGLVLVVSGLAMAGPARAGASVRWESFSAGFACPKYLVTENGILLVSAYVSDGETGLYLSYWQPGTDPVLGDPATYTSGDAIVAFDRDAMQLTATVSLVAPKSKGPIGEATLVVAFAATGATDVYRFKSGSGNHHTRGLVEWQSMDASGQLVLPNGASLGLSDCQASVESTSLSANNPTSSVERYRQANIFCAWPVPAGVASLELRRWEHQPWSGTLEVQTGSGVYWSYFDELPGPGVTFGGDMILADGLGVEGELVGALSGSVSLATAGQRSSETWRDGRWIGRSTTTFLRPRGSFSVSGDLRATFVVNAAACTGHQDVQTLIGRP